jgi:polyisoprenyl-teichoic acid--peptidoglycan teichoic acid transferase
MICISRPAGGKLHALLFILTSLFLAAFLSTCASTSSPDLVPASTPTLFLATTPANPSPTATPFQPETNTPDPYAVIVPTDTPLPTDTPFYLPTLEPTLDPNISIVVTNPTQIIAPDYAPAPMPILTDSDTITFALLGSDTRGGTSFRTDTIVIAAVRPTLGQVTLISIPRDLWVYIPNNGMNRINTAYEFGDIYHYPGGGPALLKDTILYNLGIRIDHTALVDFNGFRLIVDTLGGVDVPVACPYTDWHLIDPTYDPNNENNWALYTAGPGLIHMDGDLALWYARSRQKSNDFDRGRRSQEVLRALFSRAMQVNAIAKIPELYSDFNSTVTTDLGLSDLLALSPMALHLNNADIRSYYISSTYVTGWMTPAGASVLLPNAPAIQALITQALAPATQKAETETIKIEVRNGTLNQGWDALAAERLNYAGYDTRTAFADRTDYPVTLLYDLTATQDPNRIASLLAVLGLPSTALVSAPMQSDVSYVLILGADYQPCFNPANLTP